MARIRRVILLAGLLTVLTGCAAVVSESAPTVGSSSAVPAPSGESTGQGCPAGVVDGFVAAQTTVATAAGAVDLVARGVSPGETTVPELKEMLADSCILDTTSTVSGVGPIHQQYILLPGAGATELAAARSGLTAGGFSENPNAPGQFLGTSDARIVTVMLLTAGSDLAMLPLGDAIADAFPNGALAIIQF